MMKRKKLYRRKRRSKKQQEFINSLLFFLVSILSVSGLLTYLWVHNEIDMTARENVALEKMRDNLVAENQDLQNKIMRLRRVDRITGVAREELQMVTPDPETLVVFIHSDVGTEQEGLE